MTKATSLKDIEQLKKCLVDCMNSEQWKLARKIQHLQQRLKQKKPVDKLYEKISRDIAHSNDRFKQRQQNLPEISYPDELPVSQKHEEIQKAITDNQVVIICGETGSGKTTQLPKICLQAGLGQRGYIGHTQPRRLAARSVASRIAEELRLNRTPTNKSTNPVFSSFHLL